MPPEGNEDINLVPGIYRTEEGSFIPLGKIENVEFISGIDDAYDTDLWTMPMEFTGTIDFSWGKLTKKRLRFFRENFGIDLLHCKFPKKKNRRKRRMVKKTGICL